MQKDKNIHEGHRERLRMSVDKDPEMEALSDYEVLEYLLSFLIPRKDTNPIAHELIDTFGSFYGVLCANFDELFAIKNMTKNAARMLPNFLAIARRAEISRTSRSHKLTTVKDAADILRPYFLGRNYECLYMMLLDINDRIISIDLLSKGISNITTVDVSKIVGKISRSQACKIIFAHNHPGGNLHPSNEDIHMTNSLAHIITSMGKQLIDHLIFCGEKYYSFYENQRMNKIIQNADEVMGTNKSKEVQSRLFVDKYIEEKKCKDDGVNWQLVSEDKGGQN